MLPASYLNVYGKFSQTMMTRDVQTIIALYKTNGFLDVDVKAQWTTIISDRPECCAWSFTSTKGQQSRVHKPDRHREPRDSDRSVESQISLSDGQPYSDYCGLERSRQVVSYYYNRGFPNMDMQVTAVPFNGDKHSMDVTYNIREGTSGVRRPRLRFGLHYTRPSVVQRQMRIHDGDSLSQVDMLDTQRQLVRSRACSAK